LKSANQGYTDGQYMVGVMYAQGKIIEGDREKAIHYLTPAAESGINNAEFVLGALYLGTDCWHYPNPPEYNKARFWMYKAAKSGYGTAQAYMGDFYREGKGVEQDYQKALDWYQESAETGEPDSQHGLSIMYREGLGVEKDLVQAANWAKLAREQGYPIDEPFSII
jgi:TPR repeat protein